MPEPKPIDIGFAGTGLMGAPMAARLIGAGHRVHVWNRTADKLAPLVAAGATAAASPADLARASTVVLICLSDAAAVGAVVFGPDGLIGGRPAMIIDHSSIRPDASRDYAARLRADCGGVWVDAPVSGGVAGAAAGTLAIMAGGDDAAVARAREICAPLYARFTHLGGIGAGQVAKLCNQMIVTANIVAIAECVALARAGGIEAAKLADAFAGGFADSKPLQIMLPRMARHVHEPKIGAADTLIKDIEAIRDLATSANIRTPLADQAGDILKAMMDAGLGKEDITTLIRLYETS